MPIITTLTKLPRFSQCIYFILLWNCIFPLGHSLFAFLFLARGNFVNALHLTRNLIRIVTKSLMKAFCGA